MPAPLPPTTRRLILLRSGRGQTAAAIADALHLCPRTVRHLLQRARDPASPQGTAYRPGPGRPDDDHPLRAQALALRQQHPTWGAGYIRVRLATEADPATVPSERTLQRWFRRQRHPPAAGGRRSPSAADRAIAPHDIWQRDAAEQLRTADGQAPAGCGWWMNIRGPSWAPRFSPHYYWAHVPEAEVQRHLRRAFERWGLPPHAGR